MAAKRAWRLLRHPVREIRRHLQLRYATDVTPLLQAILDLGGTQFPAGTWKITSTLHVSSGLSGVHVERTVIRLVTGDPGTAAFTFLPRETAAREEPDAG